ncbi:MAG: hypothetical protein J6E31_08750 [Pyramidobacter sp.]|nr:hypothetical protein [Pyramidobacter sp.]
MKEIRVFFDYGCLPVWHYNTEDSLGVPELPEKRKHAEELQNIFEEIEERYEALFINTPQEFTYRGFQSEKARQEFHKLYKRGIELLKKDYGADYKLEYDDDLSELDEAERNE